MTFLAAPGCTSLVSKATCVLVYVMYTQLQHIVSLCRNCHRVSSTRGNLPPKLCSFPPEGRLTTSLTPHYHSNCAMKLAHTSQRFLAGHMPHQSYALYSLLFILIIVTVHAGYFSYWPVVGPLLSLAKPQAGSY